MIELISHAQGTILPVRAQPGARRDAINGEYGGSVRVAVTAQPDKGKANAAIARVLAQTLAVSPSRLVLVSGETSRQKRFLIAGLAVEEVRERLDNAMRS